MPEPITSLGAQLVEAAALFLQQHPMPGLRPVEIVRRADDAVGFVRATVEDLARRQPPRTREEMRAELTTEATQAIAYLLEVLRVCGCSPAPMAMPPTTPTAVADALAEVRRTRDDLSRTMQARLHAGDASRAYDNARLRLADIVVDAGGAGPVVVAESKAPAAVVDDAPVVVTLHLHRVGADYVVQAQAQRAGRVLEEVPPPANT